MPPLNWRHHTLIQALLNRGPLKEKDFHSIFSGVTGKNPGSHQELFNDYLLKINRELSSLQFELRACRDQYDGNVWYGVVNNVADEQSKLGTKYSVPQIAFYKAIIEAIAHGEMAQGSISNIDALNIRLENQILASMGSESQGGPHQIPAAIRNFTMSQKEKTLDELMQDTWLCLTPDGNIGLGVRSCLDLRSWFRSSDIPSCEVCNEAAVKGDLCQSKDCVARIHHYCLKKFFQKRGEILCPRCGKQWQNQLPKAEALEEEELIGTNQSQPSTGRTRSQPTAGRERKRPRANGGDDAVTVACSSSQASQPVSDLRRITRSLARQL
ncbi:hypothetical protein LWI28_026615 [Acer negundo]|uniref:Non-structural maintenance of chromosomes element 1 homolog n=1 Tax=Acer negundo TaxID=4023 RepID=A0AAD5IJN0_ACENE|nr:hypothetical protein LWI28_026615 [Acer negundo]KAK4844720.1 hypothetical protein QYF36_023622 [Acer negundo]